MYIINFLHNNFVYMYTYKIIYLLKNFDEKKNVICIKILTEKKYIYCRIDTKYSGNP